jgi:hypothetical protein
MPSLKSTTSYRLDGITQIDTVKARSATSTVNRHKNKKAPQTGKSTPDPAIDLRGPEIRLTEGGGTWVLPSPCGSELRWHRDPTNSVDLVLCRAHGNSSECKDWACGHYEVGLRQLLAGPMLRPPLLPWRQIENGRPHGGPPVSNPDFEALHQALLKNPTALSYLRVKRGLNLDAVGACGFGYGQVNSGRPPGFVIPVDRHAGRTFRVRYWPDPWTPGGEVVKIATPRGHSPALWPKPPALEPYRLLVEGELDAAVLRSRGWDAWGAPGIGVPEELLHQMALNAKAVGVIFDVPNPSRRNASRVAADRAVTYIRSQGTFAFRVDLPLTQPDADITDWFITYGRSKSRLRTCINRAYWAQKETTHV